MKIIKGLISWTFVSLMLLVLGFLVYACVEMGINYSTLVESYEQVNVWIVFGLTGSIAFVTLNLLWLNLKIALKDKN